MFIESPRFPDKIALHASGGPGFLTSVLMADSASESRDQRWSRSRLEWDVGQVAKPLSEFNLLRDFFLIAKGRANGFRFKDWTDYKIAAGQGYLQTVQDGRLAGSVGLGYGAPVYQLLKRTTAGAYTYDRIISKPISEQVIVSRAGVPVTVGASEGNVAIDFTSGLVIFVADATSSVASVTVGATTAVSISAALPGIPIGGYLYLSELGGADAALLNGRSHHVSDISGGTYILDTNTTGKIITVGSGVASQFPQPNQALIWTGEFDVPCRFDTDKLKADIIDKEGRGELLISWPNIPVVELKSSISNTTTENFLPPATPPPELF